jgi:hypothetical protein
VKHSFDEHQRVCLRRLFLYVTTHDVIDVFPAAYSNDVCDATGIGATIMCPACDRWCNYTLLKESCFYARITHVFDNRATIAMAVFMSAWGLYFDYGKISIISIFSQLLL